MTSLVRSGFSDFGGRFNGVDTDQGGSQRRQRRIQQLLLHWNRNDTAGSPAVTPSFAVAVSADIAPVIRGRSESTP
jgi:hypothetical protein